jgi:aspartate aminotransferase
MKLSERACRIEPSVTLGMNATTKDMIRQGIDVTNFSVGEPDFDTPENVKNAAIKAIHSGFTKYTPAAGIIELKQAVCAKFRRDNNLDYTPSEVAISVGAKHALYNIFQVLLNSGDEVIVPAPYWVSYVEQVRVADGIPVIISATEEHNFKITAAQIEAALTPRTRALILNSPSNPTGAVYTYDELDAIAKVAVKHELVVVSDEIYEPFLYTTKGHTSIAQLGPEIKALTLLVHGVSKSHAMTGWRIGYTVGDKRVIAAISDLQSHSTSNPSSVAQMAAIEALTGNQGSVHNMCAAFHQRRDYVVERLNAIPGIQCTLPEGSFYVFPNVSELFGTSYEGTPITDTHKLAELLLTKAHVALVPGNAFGADNYVRISYAASMDKLAQGMDRIAAFVGKLR